MPAVEASVQRWLAVTLALVFVAGLAACGEEGPPAREPAANPPPGLAEVVCDERGMHALTPVARAQPDGVHLRVTNRTAKGLSLLARDETGESRVVAAPAGAASYVWSVAPGRLSLGCFDQGSEDSSELDGLARIDVVDPERLWVSPRLTEDCDEATTIFADFGQAAWGERGKVATVAQRMFQREGLYGGRTEKTGYPRDGGHIFRLVRAGEVVATAALTKARAGGWLVDELTMCKSG